MSEKTIVLTYEMPAVVPFPAGHYEADDTLPYPELICGVELEIEELVPRAGTLGFTFTPDGSLRNNGIEAVSSPTPMRFFPAMLKTIFTQHRVTRDNYSERCSTHVHVNVQDMTWTQLRVVCLLYQVFERLLFNFVGNDRQSNIFCVPWAQSGMSAQFVEKLMREPDRAIRNWVKYTALNLLPVRSQGTIEFRHLHGTCDVELIMAWMRILSRMFLYAKASDAKKLKETILELNTVSNYDQFMTDVFGADAPLLAIGDYQTALSNGVIDAKIMLLKPKLPTKSFYAVDPDLEAALRRFGEVTTMRQQAIQADIPADTPAARPPRPRAARPARGITTATGQFILNQQPPTAVPPLGLPVYDDNRNPFINEEPF